MERVGQTPAEKAHGNHAASNGITARASGVAATTTGSSPMWPHRKPQSPMTTHLLSSVGGMLSSAWDGVCSGVASAAWHAVQGTAGAMLKARGVTTASKHDESKSSFDTSAKSLMSCLAGKPAETLTVASQEKPTHHQEGPPSGNDVSNQVLLSYLCWSCRSSSCSCSLCCNNKSCNCRAPKLRCPTLPSHRLR